MLWSKYDSSRGFNIPVGSDSKYRLSLERNERNSYEFSQLTFYVIRLNL